jgi:hypothetical protein
MTIRLTTFVTVNATPADVPALAAVVADRALVAAPIPNPTCARTRRLIRA